MLKVLHDDDNAATDNRSMTIITSTFSSKTAQLTKLNVSNSCSEKTVT